MAGVGNNIGEGNVRLRILGKIVELVDGAEGSIAKVANKTAYIATGYCARLYD
jgi:hypothetical protein